MPPGSSCRVAKPAHSGTNWASGVIDEHFHYQASAFSRGGRCTVGSTKRDTLVAVYATCSRFGSQSPVGFANSEGGRTATVSFPCSAGSSFYIFCRGFHREKCEALQLPKILNDNFEALVKSEQDDHMKHEVLQELDPHHSEEIT